MSQHPTVTIPVELPAEWARNLEALIDPNLGIADIAGVLAEFADHAQQAVYRPGAWEREWICKAFGYDWLGRLEPDPRAPHIYQRPRSLG